MKTHLIAASLAAFALIAAAPAHKSHRRALPPVKAAPVSVAIPAAKPALWQLSDADTTIYLFGTIHALPKDLKWQSLAFDNAVSKAQELVLEVADIDDQAKSAATFMKLGMSPGLPPMMDRIPAEKRASAKVMMTKSGIPVPFFDQLETWAAGLGMAAGMFKDLNVSPEDGVERRLMILFKTAKKPVLGLETMEQQLGFFDTLPEAVQRTFLIGMLDESADPKAEFDKMLKSWTSGDEKGIALSFDDELKMSPELVDVLLRNRNANWTSWIADRMARPGVVMIAVGAGHLAGEESVQTMLAKRGLKVTRLQ
jgi:uncharacterized protein